MTTKRFTITQNGDLFTVRDTVKNKPMGMFEFKTDEFPVYFCFHKIIDKMNELNDENERLKNRLKDWHQRAFKAHEYFDILEKVIDEVCDDDISNQIWEEYGKREKLIE